MIYVVPYHIAAIFVDLDNAVTEGMGIHQPLLVLIIFF